MSEIDNSIMWTRAARVESFKKPQKKQKKRASTQTKKTLTAKWPHETPTAEQLARAGFYFHFANDEDVDSTRCFTCGLKLDGWEPEDDPIKEHLGHIKGTERCAWATCLSVARSGSEEPETRDPLSEELLSARKDTYGLRWPHDGKRGWKCNSDRMAEAGWSFDPSPEDADGVTCHYCGLELSGFEPKDDPFEEHKRRNSSCRYFELIDFYHEGKLPKKRRTKATKSRSSVVSKASRTSMRSVVSTAMTEDVDDGGTDILGNDEIEVATPVSRVDEGKPKRAQKAKPASKSTKSRQKTVSQANDAATDGPEHTENQPAKKKQAVRASKTQAKSKKESFIEQRASQASQQLQAELEESILESSPNYWVNPERESIESLRGIKRTSDGSVKSNDIGALDFPIPPTAAKDLEQPKQKRAKTSKVSRTKPSISSHLDEHEIALASQKADEEAITQELARIEAEESAKIPKRAPVQSKGRTKAQSTSQAIQILADEIDLESNQNPVKDSSPERPLHNQDADLTPSPSGSDKENNPSSLESGVNKAADRASYMSPTASSRIPLAHSTPNRSPRRGTELLSPSKRQLGNMTSAVPWHAIDIDTVLLSPSQNSPGKLRDSLANAAGILPPEERKMTVEAWIKWKAGIGEDDLKKRCEEMVGRFESQGNKALESLHSLSITA